MRGRRQVRGGAHRSGRHSAEPVRRHARARASRGARRLPGIIGLLVALLVGAAALALVAHTRNDGTAVGAPKTSATIATAPNVGSNTAPSSPGAQTQTAPQASVGESATTQASRSEPSASSSSASTPPSSRPVAPSAATWVFAEVGARGPGNAVLSAGPASSRKDAVRSSASRCPVARGDLLVPFAIRLRNTGGHAQTFALTVTGLGHRVDGTTLLAQVTTGGRRHCYGRDPKDARFTVAAGRLPPSGLRQATGFFLLIHSGRAKTNPPLVTIAVPERVSALGARIRCILSGGPAAVRLAHSAALTLPTATAP